MPPSGYFVFFRVTKKQASFEVCFFCGRLFHDMFNEFVRQFEVVFFKVAGDIAAPYADIVPWSEMAVYNLSFVKTSIAIPGDSAMWGVFGR